MTCPSKTAPTMSVCAVAAPTEEPFISPSNRDEQIVAIARFRVNARTL